ncbi:hypothetical protein PC122_g13154 [Phytophthora cactorum]|nr:hypothetical protein PC122_g13154 [Phytophthora cactorum]
MARGSILVVSWSGMDPAISGSAPEDTRIRAVPDAHGLYMIPANGVPQRTIAQCTGAVSDPSTPVLVPVSFSNLPFQVISLHESRQSAQVDMRIRGEYVYTYDYNYGKKDILKRMIYRCESHDKCEFRYRIGIYKSDDPHQVLDLQMFALEPKGNHCGDPTGRVQYGINHVVKQEVDAMVLGGAGPKTILKTLSLKCSEQSNVLNKFPKLQQVKSQKSYLLQELGADWYVETAILSILLSQNAIESHNGDIKTAGITMKKAKTGTFLNASIPGPLPSKMVTKAHLHVEKGSYYELKRTVKRKASRSYLFHASKYMSNRSEPSAEPVTKQRADRYIRGKQGNLDKDDTVLDITTSYQALHEVEIFYAGGRTSNFQVKLEPTMPLKTWRVDYSDDDIMYYECEALEDLILEACNRGLDMARSAAAKHSIVEDPGDSSNSMDSSSDSYSKDFYSDSDVEEDDTFGGTSSSLLELLKAEHSG